MKINNLNLVLVAILIAASGAFASSRMMNWVDVYVLAQPHNGDNYVLRKTNVQCDADGIFACWVTVPKINSPGSETVRGRDRNGNLLNNSSDVPITASWATGVPTPYEVE